MYAAPSREPLASDRYAVGEAARRGGLPVRTVRFYADEGLVEPIERSDAGYRDLRPRWPRAHATRARRSAFAGCCSARRPWPTVSAAHAELFDERIHDLALRRSVVRVIAGNSRRTAEIVLMNKLVIRPTVVPWHRGMVDPDRGRRSSANGRLAMHDLIANARLGRANLRRCGRAL